MVERVSWKAENPGLQQRILWILNEDEKCFTELYERGGWARQTLTLYLKELMKKGWVKSEKRGRKVIYSLIRSNPEVMQKLTYRRVLTRGRVQLNSLGGERFIGHWIHSIKFALLNIIKYYIELGENQQDAERMNRDLDTHLSDLLEVTKYYGEFMAKRIRAGTLESTEIWEDMERLRLEIMDYKG